MKLAFLLVMLTFIFFINCRSFQYLRYGLEGRNVAQIANYGTDTVDLNKLDKVSLKGFSISDYKHPSVIKQLNRYQNKRKKAIAVSIERGAVYIPIIRQIFKEKGIPKDLIYLPIIESSFRPQAVSSAGARGIWQFMYQTGKIYKLKGNYWYDDRSDIFLSTVAAAYHLKYLYKQFDNWLLVLAAYNAGSGKISRAIKRYKTKNFWELIKYSYLKKETKEYVPRFIAATLIAKNPRQYNININIPKNPISFKKVIIEDATDLKLIADCAKIPYSLIKKYNPALKHWFTPPEVKFKVYIPEEKEAIFLENFKKILPGNRITFRRAFVNVGDSLSTIAKRYNVPINPIAQLNKFRSIHRITAGSYIIIPIRGLKNANKSDKQRKETTKKIKTNPLQAQRIKKINNEDYIFFHLIDKKDTLYKIAKKFKVSLLDLMRWNEMKNPNSLYPGRLMVIKIKKKK